MSRPRALVLTGSLGMGHHVVTEVVADSLEQMGWSTGVFDCMSMLGRLSGKTGDWVFRHIMDTPTLYDGVHFSHFRTASRLAALVDWGATKRLVPALADHLVREPVDLLVSTFATGASTIAKLGSEGNMARPPARVALCTDVCMHSLWVREGMNLFLVTSEAAAASVRRYLPRAPIAIVPAPVRPQFHQAPTQAKARATLGIDPEARCALVMGGGWGLGPLAETAEALAAHGVVVLVVAGHNEPLAVALDQVARRQPGVVPFRFTDQIPTLMAACDLVLTTPGATTCSEARVVSRPLLLLDVMPGHGRDNVQHELELGQADVCDADPGRLVECALGALERSAPPGTSRPDADRFGREFASALAMVGIFPSLPEDNLLLPDQAIPPAPTHTHTPTPTPEEVL
ncbi:MAG TPA: glycosyltransferase [Acidimicrobiales bacterium]|jgi:UDP-N-acetylglucosamine:LPS N-acetylglucosamine transferase|nr:glycosyltransferase [Acidimicrobiales bacterium]